MVLDTKRGTETLRHCLSWVSSQQIDYSVNRSVKGQERTWGVLTPTNRHLANGRGSERDLVVFIFVTKR